MWAVTLSKATYNFLAKEGATLTFGRDKKTPL